MWNWLRRRPLTPADELRSIHAGIAALNVKMDRIEQHLSAVRQREDQIAVLVQTDLDHKRQTLRVK